MHALFLDVVGLAVCFQQLVGTLDHPQPQGMAAYIGISNFFRAFKMVPLNSPSSGPIE